MTILTLSKTGKPSDLLMSADATAKSLHPRTLAVSIDLADVTAAVCEHLELEKDVMASHSRRASVALGRGLVGFLAVNEFGISGTEVARLFAWTVPPSASRPCG